MVIKTKVIKFDVLSEQNSETRWGLDETLIPYWHIIQETDNGEYTACGQATTEYEYSEEIRNVTCPYCLQVIDFYKKLLSKEVKVKKQNGGCDSSQC